MNYYDNLMLQYYRVLNNAWKRKIREAAYQAIEMLYSLRDSRAAADLSAREVEQMMGVIGQRLGPDFSAQVASETNAYIERAFRLGLQDVKTELRGRITIGLYGAQDAYATAILQNQQMFWLGEHFGADVSAKFRATLTEAMSRGLTTRQLAEELKTQFEHLGKQSEHYWQGLAEHTALRVRELARINGYEKAGIQYYRLVNPMDERTSDICWALVSAGQIYEVKVASEVRDNLLSIDMNKIGLEAARDQIKALAPWVKESQVVRDVYGNPTGVQGAHTPFPPFHWKCRTVTEAVV